MGLFSFFSKNKQDRTAEDSGRFYSKDDDAAIGERARAKRASNAGGGASGRRSGNDPMLPEKKRARRRLVGAIALALAAAVGLPMLLDSEPKPLAGDIAIQIPSRDKAAPLPVPGEAGEAQQGAAAAPGGKAVAAEDSVGKDEEIIDAPPPSAAKAPAVVAKAPEPKPETVKAKPEPKPETAKPEHKPETAKPDTRAAERAERERTERLERERAQRAERERADKAEKAEKAERAERAERDRAERLEKLRAEEKARQKQDEKPAKPTKAQSDARAIAILEGKAAAERDKPVDKDKLDTDAPKVTLQVAAMSSQEKAAEVQARLRGAGISSHTEKFGDLIRVKVGPLSKDEAERVRAKLSKLGL